MGRTQVRVTRFIEIAVHVSDIASQVAVRRSADVRAIHQLSLHLANREAESQGRKYIVVSLALLVDVLATVVIVEAHVFVSHTGLHAQLSEAASVFHESRCHAFLDFAIVTVQHSFIIVIDVRTAIV